MDGERGAARPQRFNDISRESGLTAFRHTDGSSGRRFFAEQASSGCAIFDYDGDGWQDIYLCSGRGLPGYKGPAARNALFRNRRDGTFEDVTVRAGVSGGDHFTIGAATGDFDNDGDLDLYLTCFGPNVLFRNNGDGTFCDVTRAAGVGDPRFSVSAAWGDYNGDGFLDLYVANYVKYRLEDDRWCSKIPGHKSYCGPIYYPAEDDTLYRNNGDDTFTDVSRPSGIRRAARNGLGVIWLDYNEDGRPDVFVANDQTPNLLWRNNGDGTFTDVAATAGVAFGEQGNTQAGMGVDAGDYDNDGRVDLTVTNFSEESNALYHNEGGGIFRERSFASGMGQATLMYLGFGTGFLDYDRDGWLDLFYANGHVMDDIDQYSDAVTWAQSNQLFRNRGDGTFMEVSAATGVGEGKRVSRGAAFGDLFNRGQTDVLVNVLRGEPLLLRNDCAPAAHWLELDLRAAWGNPQAIGARVLLTAGGITQRRDVLTGRSYASASDPRPLFGLGRLTRVDEVKVVWPSGQTTSLHEPPIDRILRVEEAGPSHPAASP